jgi:GNAT superfamily N-acetyltransferase
MNLQLVECSNEFWEYVRILRLNPKVASGFIETIHISVEDQIKYMNSHSNNYRIVLADGVPCGYVGVINNDIRVCTDPSFQGRGIGKFMINSIKEIWPDAVAKIKIQNEVSLRLFKSCGYDVEFYLLTPRL